MQAAQRVFAGELAHPGSAVIESDAGDGTVLLTPSGARCGRLFIVGACTEIVEYPGRIEARIADPTGAFVFVVFFDQHALVERLRSLTPPAFVAVTCDVRVRDASSPPQVSIIPETIAPATRQMRDLWVLMTAEHTLGRLERNGSLLPSSSEHTTDIATMVQSALETVHRGEMVVPVDQRQVLIDILAEKSGPRGMPVERLIESGLEHGLSEEAIGRIIDDLRAEGDCYMPATGYVKLL